ncbi:FadR/GntR family transcriptional regulator [Rathayibacter soli]|uniref:FadR/GntR family transcriptional regulator n=1 Tax=Rathayibacter soli TaxID=3144168 RepID=UPI0027E4ED0D|nr:FCD domain-containing protein [Glaciibacter superstes]
MSETLTVATPLVDTVLQPVRGHMAFESCVEQLGSAIQLGVFRAGSKLPNERDLSERLNVSRATLREAISALRAAGFVSTTRGRGGGTVVEPLENARPLDPALSDPTQGRDRQTEMNDILVFRAVVEPGACYQAAIRPVDAAGRDLLTKCLQEFDGVESPAAYRQADARLHLAIASACGSTELSNACSTVQTKVHQYLAEIPFLRANITGSDEQHRTIVAAILDGDGDTARLVMEEHCDATAALLKGLLK